MKDNKPKMTRKEREKQMIAEMESALLEQKFPESKVEKTANDGVPTQTEKPKKSSQNVQKNEPKFHCPRCKTVMENGKCPTCGHYIYVPMDKEKQKKIRLIVGGICMVGFVILFVLLQLKK